MSKMNIRYSQYNLISFQHYILNQ